MYVEACFFYPYLLFLLLWSLLTCNEGICRQGSNRFLLRYRRSSRQQKRCRNAFTGYTCYKQQVVSRQQILLLDLLERDIPGYYNRILCLLIPALVFKVLAEKIDPVFFGVLIQGDIFRHLNIIFIKKRYCLYNCKEKKG
jgi:hypothetical protein